MNNDSQSLRKNISNRITLTKKERLKSFLA